MTYSFIKHSSVTQTWYYFILILKQAKVAFQRDKFEFLREEKAHDTII